MLVYTSVRHVAGVASRLPKCSSDERCPAQPGQGRANGPGGRLEVEPVRLTKYAHTGSIALRTHQGLLSSESVSC